MKAPSIQSGRRKKFAVVYVRTATVDPAASAEQRALTALPRDWAWPKRLIKIIDADSGRSGLSADRPGRQRLIELMDQGRVGLVVVRDVSRVSRDPEDLWRFVTKAIQRGILIAVNDRIVHLPAALAASHAAADWLL